MTDVRQQLTEALDEVERLARRAAEVCGCCLPAGVWAFDEKDEDGRILIVDDPHPGVPRKPLSRRWNGSYEGLYWAAHIARWDPATVLRLIERDRALLADITPGGEGHWLATRILEGMAAFWLDNPEGS